MTLQEKVKAKKEKQQKEPRIKLPVVLSRQTTMTRSLSPVPATSERKEEKCVFYYFRKGEKDTIPRKVITIKAQKDWRIETDTNQQQ